MTARGKRERSEHVAPGSQSPRAPRPEGPKYYFALSGLDALFNFVTRGDALRACPWLSYCAPLALRFIRASAFGAGAPEAAGGDVSVGDFIDDEVVGG